MTESKTTELQPIPKGCHRLYDPKNVDRFVTILLILSVINLIAVGMWKYYN